MLAGEEAGGELDLEVSICPDGAPTAGDDNVDGEERSFVEPDSGAVFILLQRGVSFVFEAGGVFEALGGSEVGFCHFLTHAFFDGGVVGALDADFEEAFYHAEGLEEALLQGFGDGLVFEREGVGVSQMERQAQMGVEARVAEIGVEPHFAKGDEVVEENDEAAGLSRKALVFGRVNGNAEVVILKLLCSIAGDEERHVAFHGDMLLGFRPGSFDGDKDIIAPEDGAGFMVDLAVREEEVQVVFVGLVAVFLLLLVVDGAEDVVIYEFSDLAGEMKER